MIYWYHSLPLTLESFMSTWSWYSGKISARMLISCKAISMAGMHPAEDHPSATMSIEAKPMRVRSVLLVSFAKSANTSLLWVDAGIVVSACAVIGSSSSNRGVSFIAVGGQTQLKIVGFVRDFYVLSINHSAKTSEDAPLVVSLLPLWWSTLPGDSPGNSGLICIEVEAASIPFFLFAILYFAHREQWVRVVIISMFLWCYNQHEYIGPMMTFHKQFICENAQYIYLVYIRVAYIQPNSSLISARRYLFLLLLVCMFVCEQDSTQTKQ